MKKINIAHKITSIFLLLGALIFSACTKDNGEGWADDRYLSNFEIYWGDHPNPKTGVAYTTEELAELKYDLQKEERYKGDQPIVLDLFVSKQIKDIKILDGTDLSVLLTVTDAQPDGDKFKVSFATSLTELNVEPGMSKALKFNITYQDGSIGSIIYKVGSVLPLPPVAGILKGQWKFDNPVNLTKATLGIDLTLGARIGAAAHSAVAGISGGDGASMVPRDSFYEITHGLAPTNGGNRVNNWTLIFDVKKDINDWVNLLQTTTNNSADGTVFITSGGSIWGRGIGTGGGGITNGQWHRVVLTFATGDFRAYVDGVKVHVAGPGKDGSFSFEPEKFLVFADNSSEDSPVTISEIMLFDVTFDDNWVTDDVPPVGVAFL